MASKFINKLFQWSKQSNGSFSERVKDTWKLLQATQNTGNMEEKQKLQKEWERMLLQEEQYWW